MKKYQINFVVVALVFSLLTLLVRQKTMAQNNLLEFRTLDVQTIYSYIKNNPTGINEEGQGGQSFLHIAAYIGDTKLALFLIERGGDVHAKDERGWTPLHVAAYKGHQDFAEFLLQQGVDINTIDYNDRTPLYIATYRNHVDFVKFLLRHGATVDAVDQSNWTSLSLAAYKNRMEIALNLLEAGANVNHQDPSTHWTPLYLAIHSGNKEMLSLFIKRGADINGVDYLNRTPFFFALHKGEEDIASFLIKQDKIDIHTPNINGVRPFDLAVFIGNTDLLSALLDRNALTDSFASFNDWSLYEYGLNPIETFSLIEQARGRYLRDRGVAQLTEKDINDWISRISWILNGGHAEMIMATTTYKENQEDYKKYQEGLNQINTIDPKTGQTYLHSALYRRPDSFFKKLELNHYTTQITYLMEKGFDIGLIDDGGHTPLHWALYGADEKAVKFFKEKYYDPAIEALLSQKTCADILS